jgi:hypothetical protein
MDRRAIFESASRFLRRNPAEAARIVRSALGLRLGLPIDALRFLAKEVEKSGKVEDIVLEPVPPGLRVSATVEQMKTKIRVTTTLYIERVRANESEMRIELRLEDTHLRVVGGAESPLAFLVRSGALDVSKPGTLVKHLPSIPPVVVEAQDKRIVLDLARHPKLAPGTRARRVASAVLGLVTLHGVETDEGHVDVAFRAFPEGLMHAATTIRQHALPAARKALALLPRLAGR